MAEPKKIQKVLAGAEDILFGQGQTSQVRGSQQLQITKVNASNIPYSGDVATGNFVSIKAKLDKAATQTSGFGALVLPAGSTSQRPSIAYDGYTRYNTDLGEIEYYNSELDEWTVPGAVTVAVAATKLETARTINGVSFDGTANITLDTLTSGEIEAGFVSQTNSQGAAQLPVGVNSQRPAVPATGMFRYNSELSRVEVYNGSTWQSLTPTTVTWQ